MFHFSATELTRKQNYKFLTGSVIPRPIAWITTQGPDQLTNLAPFSFFNVVGSSIPLVMVSINRKGPQMKDSARNLLAHPEGVIQIVSQDLITAMNQTAASLEPDKSELNLTDLELIDSHTVSVPGIKEAKIRLEVQVHQYVPIELAGTIINDLFILKVTDYHFSDDIFDPEKEYLLPDKIDPVARLAGNNYANITNFQTIKRPD